MVLRRAAKLVALSVLSAFFLITISAAKAQWERISYIEWSPDGTMLAVSGGTTLHVVNAQTMENLNTFYGLKDQFTAPSWSPDGNRLAIANGPEIQIWQEPWDVNNAQLVAAFQSTARYIMSLAWSPNDDRIAVTDGALEVWDVSAPTPALLYSRTEHGMWIEQVAWSPTGDLLATASLDYTVKIWDSATGEVLSTMTVVTDLVSSSPSEFFAFATTVSWSPDESRLVFGAEDGSVRIWDRTRLSGSEVRTQYGDPGVFRQHEGAVWSVSWNPAQPEVASGSTDGTVRIWDVNTGELKQVISVGSAVGSVAWSPDGTRLAYGNENGSFEIVNTPPLPATPTATPDDVPGPTNAATTRAPQDVIREMAWKPDGSVLAVGNSDGTIDIRNSTTGAIEKHLTGHVGGITALAWHPTANQLLSASADRFLLWDLSTDTSYELSSTWIDDATWNADASRIIGFFDTSRYTWDAQTLPPQFLSRDQRDVPIYAIAWSADRSQVATEVLGNVILRDPSSLAWEAMVDNGGNGTIAWSPDGQWLAASDWLSGIYIWNVSSGEFQQKRVIQPPLFETLDPPLTDILALQFSQGGAELDSVGGDGTFTRWNVDTGAVIAALHLPGVPLYSAEFSPDGTQLAYGGEGGTLEIIHMPPPPATPDRGRGSANFVALPALNLYSLRITGTGERSFMVSAGHNLRTDLAYCMLWKSVRNTGYTSH